MPLPGYNNSPTNQNIAEYSAEYHEIFSLILRNIFGGLAPDFVGIYHMAEYIVVIYILPREFYVVKLPILVELSKILLQYPRYKLSLKKK